LRDDSFLRGCIEPTKLITIGATWRAVSEQYSQENTETSEEVEEAWRKLHNEELRVPHQTICTYYDDEITKNWMRWAYNMHGREIKIKCW
jgi:hypothetical protein